MSLHVSLQVSFLWLIINIVCVLKSKAWDRSWRDIHVHIKPWQSTNTVSTTATGQTAETSWRKYLLLLHSRVALHSIKWRASRSVGWVCIVQKANREEPGSLLSHPFEEQEGTALCSSWLGERSEEFWGKHCSGGFFSSVLLRFRAFPFYTLALLHYHRASVSHRWWP